MLTKRFQQTKPALGSDALLTVIAQDDTALADLWDKIAEFEQRFSRFSPNSELNNINQHAGRRVRVSGEMAALLKACQKYNHVTSGIFNPLILPKLQHLGYKASWPHPGAQIPKAIDYSDGQIADFTSVSLGRNSVQIPEHTALDFGGIGKGYLLDKLGSYLNQSGITDYWLSLGGDILCDGHDIMGEGWPIGIAMANNPKVMATTIKTEGRRVGIATSGVTKRKGTRNGHTWHHLVDPMTGTSAHTPVLTATAIATSAVEADIVAKYAVITNPSRNPPFFTDGSLLIQRATRNGVQITKLGDAKL